MDKLYTNISTLLNSKARLVEYTELTQNEVGKENVVLWNREPLSIDGPTYSEFKFALKKRPCKYYMYNNKLSYSDFCIALICCVDYSLNSKVVVGIEHKTFTSAWRALDLMSSVSSDKVCLWIKTYIGDRSAVGYCNSLGITLDNVTLSTNIAQGIEVLDNNKDRDIIDKINISTDKIIKIQYHNEQQESENNTGNVWRSTQTPEGQLYDLQLSYSEFNNTLL